MIKKYPKTALTALLIAVTILSTTGGTAYISMASSQYLASLFFGPTTDSKTTKPTTTTTPTTTPTVAPTENKVITPAASEEFTTSAEHPLAMPLNDNKFVTFSLYGQIKPSTKAELCSFLDARINDIKILAPRAMRRYTTDFSLHCKTEDQLRAAAAENNQDSGIMGFLRSASSGLEALNNQRTSIFEKPLTSIPTPPPAVNAPVVNTPVIQ